MLADHPRVAPRARFQRPDPLSSRKPAAQRGRERQRIVLAVLVGSAAIYLILYQPVGPAIYPRSIVIIDSLLLVSSIGGVRLLWRIIPGKVLRVRLSTSSARSFQPPGLAWLRPQS
jgi:hypothetical protein